MAEPQRDGCTVNTVVKQFHGGAVAQGRAALQARYHVISDKPATRDLAEVLVLKSVIESADGLYALTHTYLGYPLVKEARDWVARGEIGQLRKIYVEYPQGWLSTLLEATGRSRPTGAPIRNVRGHRGAWATSVPTPRRWSTDS